MSDIRLLLEELRSIYAFPEKRGFVKTHLPGVRFFWSTEPVPRAPILYDAGIIIIGEGHKTAYLESEYFRYDKDHYMIVSVPLPLECETNASEENPLLGIFVDIDIPALHKLVNKVSKHLPLVSFNDNKPYRGFEPVKMDRLMRDASMRLLNCLKSELDSDTLGQSLVNEILYRALLGQHGPALYALTQHHSHYARIARVLSMIHETYMKPLTVEDFAENANMSVTTFHRIFKQVTGETPLQYLKKIRLGKAKHLIDNEGFRAGVAAEKVGYESASQFSREFKRHFDMTPKQMKADT